MAPLKFNASSVSKEPLSLRRIIVAITDHPTLDATLEAVASPLDALTVSFFLAITAPGDDQVKLALRQGAIISAHLDSPEQIETAKEQAVELVRRFGSEFLLEGGE